MVNIDREIPRVLDNLWISVIEAKIFDYFDTIAQQSNRKFSKNMHLNKTYSVGDVDFVFSIALNVSGSTEEDPEKERTWKKPPILSADISVACPQIKGGTNKRNYKFSLELHYDIPGYAIFAKHQRALVGILSLLYKEAKKA